MNSGLLPAIVFLFISTPVCVWCQAVSVADFGARVEIAKGKSDEEAAKEIGHLALTERLSSQSLARLTGELNGPQSKAALMAVGDASAFLEPPQRDKLDKAAPDAAEQKQIVSRAMEYLKFIIPKLPDFYATRVTNVFEENWITKDKKGTHEPGALNFKGKFMATALYRNGKEAIHAKGAGQSGLITLGTFGPVLSGVIVNDLRSPLQWHRWEEGPNGVMAVFLFQVAEKDSQFGVSFPMGGIAGARRTGYQGEIGIDPETGKILRVTLRSDAVVGFRAVEHANIMLEYGPVAIGGRTYTCAVRGVSMSTGRYQQKGILLRDEGLILLDDILFTDYHVFRSEMRILPN